MPDLEVTNHSFDTHDSVTLRIKNNKDEPVTITSVKVNISKSPNMYRNLGETNITIPPKGEMDFSATSTYSPCKDKQSGEHYIAEIALGNVDKNGRMGVYTGSHLLLTGTSTTPPPIGLLSLDDPKFLAAAEKVLEGSAYDPASGSAYIELVNDNGTETFFRTQNSSDYVAGRPRIIGFLEFINDNGDEPGGIGFQDLLYKKEDVFHDCVHSGGSIVGFSEPDEFYSLRRIDGKPCIFNVTYDKGLYQGEGTFFMKSSKSDAKEVRRMRFKFVYQE